MSSSLPASATGQERGKGRLFTRLVMALLLASTACAPRLPETSVPQPGRSPVATYTLQSETLSPTASPIAATDVPTATAVPPSPTDTPTVTAVPPSPTASPQPADTPPPTTSPTRTPDPALAQRIEALLGTMTLSQKVGQMLMVTFDGPEVSEQTAALLRDQHVGAVVFLRGNVQHPDQVRQLTGELQNTALESTGIPLLIAVDHEGGIVNRFGAGVTKLPSNMALGATRSTDHARRVAQIAAAELRAMGINVNLAPVLDVNDNALNPVIGLRSFGESPEWVSELGTAYIDELQGAGIIATAKHYPGHGSTSTDSHWGLPIVDRSHDELLQEDLPPFRAAMAHGVGMVMTAHIALPLLHDGEMTPATLSPQVLTGLLREELGYDGVVISDDMSMRAISDRYGMGQAAVMAVQAGVDVVLIAGTYEDKAQIRNALLSAVQNGEITEARIEASVRRILRLKLQYGLFEEPAPATGQPVGAAESAAAVTGICADAVTMLKNGGRFIPADPHQDGIVLMVSPSEWPLTDWGTALGEALRQRAFNVIELVVDLQSEQSQESTLAQVQQRAPEASWFLVSTWKVDTWQASLVRMLLGLSKPVVVVGMYTPYDLASFPGVTTYLAVYGRDEANAEAAARVIAGEVVPHGVLPVTIPGLFP